MENKERNIQIDIARGIGIVLIVIGHTAFRYKHFIYLFHVAIFFIIAGYLFKEDYSANIESLKKFIFTKIKRLYIPFLIGNGICILLNNFFIDINLYSSTTHIYYTLKDILINILKVILFRKNTEMLGATWFLPILFWISIIYAAIEFGIRKSSSKKKSIVQLIVSAIFLIIGLYLAGRDVKFIRLQIFTCYIFFVFGKVISKLKFDMSDRVKMIILIFCFIMLLILNNIGTIEISQNQYTNIVYFVSVSILGWYLVYELSYFISKVKIATDVLKYIGKNTMPILILHFLAFKLVNIIGVIILKKNMEMISGFPVTFKSKGIWIIYTLFGIAFPLLVSKTKYNIKLKLSKKG